MMLCSTRATLAQGADTGVLASDADRTFCPMSSKAARRRRREQQRLRELEGLAPDPQHVACADADLASIDSLLDDAADVLCELVAAAATARERWPAMSETDELRAVLEAVRNVATDSRTKLATVRDRATQFRDEHHHLHVAGGRIVRMAPVEDDSWREDAADDIPF
jgi:hypothetical protein